MKKHGFRSIFSLLLAVMMVCSMLPTAAFAEGDAEEQPVVVESVGAPAEELKQDEVKPPEGGTPEEPKQDEVKPPEGGTSQGPAKSADAAPSDAGVPGSNRLTVSPMPNPDPTPAALNTGHKIDVRFTVLYVGDEFKIGYNYGTSESTTFVCQYTSNHSDTAYNNHTIAISDIKAAAGRATVNSGYQIVGWAKEANANPKTWQLNMSGTTACNKGNTIYLVAKNPNPTTKYTYVLKYDANGGTGAPGDDSWDTTDASIKYHYFTVTSAVPTRAGYTFKGWKGKANNGSDEIYTGGKACAVSQYGNDVVQNDNTWTRTLYAVWEENRPSAAWNEISKALGTQVYVQCVSDTENHAKQGYELRYESSAVGRVTGGYACNVYVYANGKTGLTSYVEEYNTTYPNTNHVLDSDSNTERRGFELRYDDGGNGWYIYKGDSVPIVFNVKCEEQQPEGPSEITDGDLEALLKGALKIECTVVGEHGKSYDVKKEDVRSKNVSGYNCEITFDATPYFGEFIGEFGQHGSAAGESYTKVITLKWVDGKWVATNTPVIHKVVCVPEIDPPAAPNEETVMGALKDAVKITCTTPNSGHDPKVYDLMSGFTPGTVQGDASTGYTYTISVNAGSYVYQYNAVMGGTGVDHTLDDTSPKPITLKWDDGAWVAETELPINFNVKCETENPPVDIRKPTFDELKALLSVKVECTNESATHEPKFDRYNLKKKDEDPKFAISEVDQSGDAPTCTVTIGSQPYVAAFDGTTGKAHEEADTTKTVDLVYNKGTGKWALKNADDATVVFQVACTTEEPEGPDDITDEDLKKLSVVINCTNEAAEHGYKNKSYTLDKATCEFDYREEGYACEITVPAAPYVNKYTSDTKTNHELVNPEESSKTITLRWNTETKAWAADPNSVTFDVKCEEEPVEETYTVTYKDGAGGTVFADDVHSGLKSGDDTPDYKGGIPTRDGFTFLGWEPEVVETVTGNATYTAEWKKYPAPPTELGTPVKVVCDTKPETHTAAPFALIEGTYTVGNVYGNETDGYKCDITITADEYVASYNTRFGSHTLPGDPTKTLTLKFVEDRWIAEEPAIFHVECEESITKPEAPKAEDLLSVVIHCKSDVHNDGLYDLKDGNFTVGEVEGNEADGYTCKVTVEAAQYVNKYVGEMKVNHDIVGEGTKTVTLRYESALERWIVDSTVVTFDVECIPAPNISMLQVQVHCVTPNSSHMDESYDLPEDTTLEYVEANTRKITVQAAPYVEQYGNGHELADGESESKTITATWDGVKWNFDATSVTFNVKCTTQEGPAAPTAEQVASLLKVKVSCANSSAAHQKDVPAFVYQPLLTGSFDIGGVTGSAESGYACRITVRAARYVQDFNTRSNATHTPTDGEEKPVTLYYEDGGWTVGTGSGLVEFTVICENVPAQKYTVTYTDGVDGVEIFKDQVYADLTAGTATPKFNGTPTRVGYFFAGWNPVVAANVTGNATYTATWKVDSNNNGKPDDEEERYTVTYLDGANGRAFASQVYPGLLSGTATPKFNGTPARSGYVFIGWSPVWSGTVTGNVTYTATWSTITGGLDKVPKTGDNGLTLALSALLLFSFCGAAACVVSTKKRG